MIIDFKFTDLLISSWHAAPAVPSSKSSVCEARFPPRRGHTGLLRRTLADVTRRVVSTAFADRGVDRLRLGDCAGDVFRVGPKRAHITGGDLPSRRRWIGTRVCRSHCRPESRRSRANAKRPDCCSTRRGHLAARFGVFCDRVLRLPAAYGRLGPDDGDRARPAPVDRFLCFPRRRMGAASDIGTGWVGNAQARHLT